MSIGIGEFGCSLARHHKNEPKLHFFAFDFDFLLWNHFELSWHCCQLKIEKTKKSIYSILLIGAEYLPQIIVFAWGHVSSRPSSWPVAISWVCCFVGINHVMLCSWSKFNNIVWSQPFIQTCCKSCELLRTSPEKTSEIESSRGKKYVVVPVFLTVCRS